MIEIESQYYTTGVKNYLYTREELESLSTEELVILMRHHCTYRHDKTYFENLKAGDIIYLVEYNPNYLVFPQVKKVKVKSVHINPHAENLVQVVFENSNYQVYAAKYNTTYCYVKNIWYATTLESVQWICNKVKKDAANKYKEQINSLIEKMNELMLADYKIINEDYK